MVSEPPPCQDLGFVVVNKEIIVQKHNFELTGIIVQILHKRFELTSIIMQVLHEIWTDRLLLCKLVAQNNNASN